jgi:hypothetical protein
MKQACEALIMTADKDTVEPSSSVKTFFESSKRLTGELKMVISNACRHISDENEHKRELAIEFLMACRHTYINRLQEEGGNPGFDGPVPLNEALAIITANRVGAVDGDGVLNYPTIVTSVNEAISWCNTRNGGNIPGSLVGVGDNAIPLNAVIAPNTAASYHPGQLRMYDNDRI